MKNSILFAAFILASVTSFGGTYTISADTKFCTKTGSDIKAVQGVGYVVNKNGGDFTLTGDKGDQAILGASDIATLEAGRTDKTDKIVEARENTFFSRGQIDGLFSFIEVKLESGHKVGILKSANGGVIINGSTKNCK